ncbi:hypothetical protein F5Y19DRAFT_27788 [Xylariaceae sp. FL1651]|nr:hypothetical protein F5Y19DRAFT_27788 [Xylariaceae sp. FL1651]
MPSNSSPRAEDDGFGASSISNTAVMNKQHTEKEWDMMYPHIIRLYLGEQLILGEVMRIMETRYNFRATQSMYKKRISKWQLHKYKRRNRPSPDQAHTTTAEEGGSAAAPGGTYTARRQGVMLIARRASSGGTLPPQLTDVAIDQAAKTLLASMRRLTLMHKSPTTTTQDATAAPHPAEVEVGLAPSGILAISQLYVTFSLGSTLFAKGQGQLAGKAVRKAFLMLEDIIRHAHFGLDWVLLDLLYDFVTRGQDALYATFMAHLANVADAVLPRHHPLHRIADQLLRYGSDGGGDVGTLLQRAYFSQVDAVQADPEVRAALSAQNRRVREVLIPDELPEVMDEELKLVVQGIRATHHELESQKEWGQEEEKKKKHKKMAQTTTMRRRKPPSPPSPSSPATPHSFSTPPPSPALSFASSSGSSAKNDNVTLPKFIEERTRRSLRRMEKKPDPLTLGIADRLYFSEYSPELVEVYKRKARAYEHQRRGEWAAAVRQQREMLDVMREKTALDYWGIIRELWALEKLLRKAGAGAVEEEEQHLLELELEAVRAEADERARALLADIPDDAP